MSNVLIKILMVAGTVSAVLSGCGTNGTEKSENTATTLLAESRACFESGRYGEALSLLDSIDRTLPEAVVVRGEVVRFRQEVLERLSASELSKTDSLLAVNSLAGDSLRKLIEYVGNPVEGYYVVTGETGVRVRDVAGVHCRMSPDYRFYIIATSNSYAVSSAVTLEADEEMIRSADIQFDGERNTRTNAGISITFTESESAPIADFITRHSKTPLVLSFYNGGVKTCSLTVPDRQAEAVQILYALSSSISRDKFLRLEKERLQRQLMLARQQIARANE